MLATPLLYGLVRVTSLAFTNNGVEVCVTFKTNKQTNKKKKGSCLEMFYWLAVMDL